MSPSSDLALSPQCGFASTLVGNPLSWDDQRRKLELVVETARKCGGNGLERRRRRRGGVGAALQGLAFGVTGDAVAAADGPRPLGQLAHVVAAGLQFGYDLG